MTITNQPAELLTVEEAAELIGSTPECLAELIWSGTFPTAVISVGTSTRI